jgi:hypothetical protein
MHDGSLVANDAVAVTASDTTIVNGIGLYVGTAGNVQLTTGAGNTVIIPAAAGSLIPLRFSKVWATNTTASGMVALKA